jgi:hypothetical protein
MSAHPTSADWSTWLARPEVSAADKAARLAEYVAAHQTLPPGCDFLWSETSKLVATGQPRAAILPQLFPRLAPQQLAVLLRSAAETNTRTLFAGLIAGSTQDASLTRVLSTFVQMIDEDRLCMLVRSLGQLGGLYPTDERMLGQRLLALLRKLPQDAARFSPRLAALRSGARWLPQGDDRIRAWRQFQESFERFLTACRQKASLLTASGLRSAREEAAQQLVADLAQAMPAAWYADDARASVKCKLLSELIATARLPAGVLPKHFEQKVASYFQNGTWTVPVMPLPPATAALRSGKGHAQAALKQKSAGPDWGKLAAKIPVKTIVAVLVLQVMVLVLWRASSVVISWVRERVTPQVAQQPDQTGDANPAEPPTPATTKPTARPGAKRTEGPPGKPHVPNPAPPTEVPTAAKPTPAAPAGQPPRTDGGTPPTPTKAPPKASPAQSPPAAAKPKPTPPVNPVAETPREDVRVSESKEVSFELCELDAKLTDFTLHLRGYELLDGKYPNGNGGTVEVSDARVERPTGPELARRLDVTASAPRKKTLARIDVDKSGGGMVRLTVLKHDSPQIVERLRFCVLEIRDNRANQSRYIALQKPERRLLTLGDLDPGWLRREAIVELPAGSLPAADDKLYLGPGRVQAGDKRCEFGEGFASQDPKNAWTFTQLWQKTGLNSHLKAGLQNVRISIQPRDERSFAVVLETEPQLEIMRGSTAEKIKELEDKLKALSEWREKLKPFTANSRKNAPEDYGKRYRAFLENTEKAKTNEQRYEWAKAAAAALHLEFPAYDPKSREFANWVFENIDFGRTGLAQFQFQHTLWQLTSKAPESSKRLELQKDVENVFRSLTALEADVYRVVEVRDVNNKPISVRVLILGRPLP